MVSVTRSRLRKPRKSPAKLSSRKSRSRLLIVESAEKSATPTRKLNSLVSLSNELRLLFGQGCRSDRHKAPSWNCCKKEYSCCKSKRVDMLAKSALIGKASALRLSIAKLSEVRG